MNLPFNTAESSKQCTLEASQCGRTDIPPAQRLALALLTLLGIKPEAAAVMSCTRNLCQKKSKEDVELVEEGHLASANLLSDNYKYVF